ncbi:hypothetical protein [Pseudomonas sp. Ant30-3]|uniref:hypothetical protein n=1 Tax=Pseudomonas sp. Ant30-3 TaxID=1488328 RepID=UPI00067C8EAF|nr:hypothetical protein [Pseudomonas sp. Ant30-3]
MEIFATCIECMQTKGMPLLKPFHAQFFDDRISLVQCDYGHDMAIVLKAQKFELLLESGANALIANFTLEASASFSAALERFFEFANKIFLTHLKMEDALYDAMFKTMSRQSERQMGAFLALHSLIFCDAYKPSSKVIEFRNAVIHKGTIPTIEQAKEFCELVYIEIYKISSLLKIHCSDAIETVLESDFDSRVLKVPEGKRIHGANRSSIFSISSEKNKGTFSEALDNYERFNATLRHASENVPKMLEALQNNPEMNQLINSIRPK